VKKVISFALQNGKCHMVVKIETEYQYIWKINVSTLYEMYGLSEDATTDYYQWSLQKINVQENKAYEKCVYSKSSH